jgi:glutamate synthase (NADPH/NADH) large chain
MVDVLSVPKDQSEKLRSIISKFHAETSSVVAQKLLDDWESSVKRISMVMPRDYAKVLNVIDKAEREGRSAEQAIMEVLNG